MKKLTVCVLALAALAGGFSVTSAASSPEVFSNYGVSMSWANPTNDTGVATALLYIPYSGINTPNGVYPQINTTIGLNTDGSGKITGSGYLYVSYGSNTPPLSYFLVDVTGNVTGKDGASTKVKLSFKGSGYTVMDSNNNTGTNSFLNNINFTFDGSPAANPDTNCFEKFVIAGTLKGQITGNTPQGTKSFKLDGRAATLGNPTGLFCQPGFDRDFFSLSAAVLSNSKKIQAWGDMIDEALFTGSGSVKNGAYKLSGKGIGSAKGASFSVDGNLSKSVTNLVVIGTNAPVPVIIITPGTANLKGKAAGQTVSGAAITIEAE